MKKVFFVLFVVFSLIGAAHFVYAGSAGCICENCPTGQKACSGKSSPACVKKVSNKQVSNNYTKGLPQVSGEVEKIGEIKVTYYGKYHKIDRVVLKSDSGSIKLIHSAKHSLRDIEKMNGKTVIVRGKIRPPSRKHPEVAFEVIHLIEVK